MKKCSKCTSIKDFNLFYTNVSSKDGYNSWCKECIKINTTQYKKNNPSKVAKWVKTYHLKHKEALKIKQRNHKLKKKFGLSLVEYESLLIIQKHRCAICQRHQNEVVKTF